MMAGFETITLEKGMYHIPGKSFTQVLEELDSSENYRGTPLEGLDAFQRQLKRYDMKVSGVGASPVEQFFSASGSAALFPEYVARAVRQGMERGGKAADLAAAVTVIDGLDYRTIDPEGGDWEASISEEGAQLPQATLRTSSGLVKMHKRGRVLSSSYEALRGQRLELLTVTLGQIGAGIAAAQMRDAVDALINGDGVKEGIAFTPSEVPVLRGLFGAVGKLGALPAQCDCSRYGRHPEAAADRRVQGRPGRLELPGHWQALHAPGRHAGPYSRYGGR